MYETFLHENKLLVTIAFTFKMEDEHFEHVYNIHIHSTPVVCDNTDL